MTGWRGIWLSLALAGAIALAIWGVLEWRRSMTRPLNGVAAVFVFYDRRSVAKHKVVYIILPEGIIAQQARFPGNSDPVWYFRAADGVTKALVEGLDARIGALKADFGPFVPPGPNAGVYRYSDEASVLLSEHMFYDDDPAVTRLMHELHALLLPETRVEPLPASARSRTLVRKHFGLQE